MEDFEDTLKVVKAEYPNAEQDLVTKLAFAKWETGLMPNLSKVFLLLGVLIGFGLHMVISAIL
jgi:hypothetical protein